MAFVTVVMILVFSGCIGTVLYLGRKKTQNDDSDWSSTWPDSQYDDEYGRRYSSGSDYSGSAYSGSRSEKQCHNYINRNNFVNTFVQFNFPFYIQTRNYGINMK